MCVLHFVFRPKLPNKADFIQHCLRHVTRMTADHQSDSVSASVQDQTTQDIDYCSLPVVTGTVPSMSDFSGVKLCESTDVHIGLDVEALEKTDTAVGQYDCGSGGECTSITLIAYCLAQYMSVLDVEHQDHVQSRISSDTVSWISKLFR